MITAYTCQYANSYITCSNKQVCNILLLSSLNTKFRSVGLFLRNCSKRENSCFQTLSTDIYRNFRKKVSGIPNLQVVKHNKIKLYKSLKYVFDMKYLTECNHISFA